MILDFKAENPFVNPSMVQKPVPIDKRLASPYKILSWSQTSYYFTLYSTRYFPSGPQVKMFAMTNNAIYSVLTNLDIWNMTAINGKNITNDFS